MQIVNDERFLTLLKTSQVKQKQNTFFVKKEEDEFSIELQLTVEVDD